MSGNFELLLLAAHIRWGDEGEKGRVPELELLASWVADRAKSDPRTRDVLVVGDFNIPDLRGPAYKAVTAKGLLMPKALAGVKGSNLAQDKRYDQTLHLPSFSGAFTGKGGVVDFYAGDHAALYRGMGGRAAGMTKEAFTYELSDHLPLWVQVGTDDDRERRHRVQGGLPWTSRKTS